MAKSKAKDPPATPPSSKKQKRAQQPTLNAFFASPNGRLSSASDAKSAAASKHASRRKRQRSHDPDDVINLDDSESDGFELQDEKPGKREEEQLPAQDNAEAGPGPTTLANAERRRSAEAERKVDESEDGELARRLAREEGWDVDGNGHGKDLAHTSEVKSEQGAKPVKEADTNPSKPAKKKPPIADMFLPSSQRVKRETTPLQEVDTKPSLLTPSRSAKPEPTAYVSLHDLSAAAKAEPDPTDASAPQAQALDFDVDVLMFRPEVAVKRMKPWPGGRLPYEVLVQVYMAVGGTRSRLAIVRILTNFLRLLTYHSPQDLLCTIYLLSNHLKPSYIPLELGVGSQVLGKAITEVSGVGRDGMKKLWNKWGDPGDVAFEAKSNMRTLVSPAPLMAHQVYAKLLQIAKTKGNGSGKAKGEIVRRLLVQAKGEEVRYLVRTLVSHLRIGAVRLTLLSSLARSFVLTRARTSAKWQDSCSVHANDAELDQVKPIPVKVKGKAKAKEEPDEMRAIIEAKLIEGMALLRRVYVRHPNYDDIVQALLYGGLDNLVERVPLSVGIPLSPMLGSITRSMNEVFTRLGPLPFTAEAKLDGQRVQIHARMDGPSGDDDGGGRWVKSADGKHRCWVRLFSRHLEDMTEKYPDICSMVLSLLLRPCPAAPQGFSDDPALSRPSSAMIDMLNTQKVTSFVMDAEVVAIDKDTGAYKTFQELSNRAKKDVKVEDIKVIVGVFAFDLMLINDQPLLDQPFSIRRHLLRNVFPPFFDQTDLTLARFSHVESIDSTKPEDVQAFFEMVVSQKCEGLMVKLLESGLGIAGEDEEEDLVVNLAKEEVPKDKANGGRKKPLPSTYEPDARSQGWLKVKKDYLEGMGDSLDLVPIGAWWGQGRKAGWWSPILLALYNPETGALEAVCKCISGFTDQFYKDLSARYPAEGMPEKCSKVAPLAYVETGGYRPDVWFDPSEVWEIRGADISLSPVYPAAMSYLGGERGLSMRFPRFIRLRDDKTWEEATTAAQFASMYRKQIAAAPARAGVEAADIDVEMDGAADEEDMM